MDISVLTFFSRIQNLHLIQILVQPQVQQQTILAVEWGNPKSIFSHHSIHEQSFAGNIVSGEPDLEALSIWRFRESSSSLSILESAVARKRDL